MPFEGFERLPQATPITETKPEVFSLEGLVAWLETQNPATIYAFWQSSKCGGGCLLHRYLVASGKHPDDDYAEIAWLVVRDDLELQDEVARPTPWTYGAALDRARKLFAAR